MQIEVNGARLWFDVEGLGLVPDGASMHERPTLILIHGGPGSYDHSYFKPWFSGLSAVAQVVYLDLRDHGRSSRHDPSSWSLEVCADDIRAFCDALGIVRPVVLGHSMGGFVAIVYGARYPGHAGGLVLSGTMARFDLERLTEGFRRAGGDEVAELAHRSYSDDGDVTEAEWSRVYASFGPTVPSDEVLSRRIGNPDVGQSGGEILLRLDIRDQLPRITSRTLVCVGELDPVTPVPASEEILAGLAPGIGRMEVIPGAGHFTWLDAVGPYEAVIRSFIASLP